MTITTDTGITGTLARIREIQAPLQTAAPAASTPATGTSTAFAQQLAQAQTSPPGAGTSVPGKTDPFGTGTPTGVPAGTRSLTVPSTAGVPGEPMVLVPLSALQGSPTTPATAGTPAITGDGSGVAGAGPRGQAIARIATAELGVREQPPGSNNGPRIAEYRTATKGSGVGPWCAYFTSWVAAQAGVPIGTNGQGEGWVPAVERWGKDTGRWIASGSGQSAQVGDLIVFDRNGDGLTDHIGVVTGVRSDGGVDTVEGNSSDAVSRRSYGPGEWAGLVRLVPPGQ